MVCTGVAHIVLYVLCSTRISGGYIRPSEYRSRGILALSGNYFYKYIICTMWYLFRPYGPDFNIYKFRNGGPNQATWLKQNLCSFLSSKNCVHAPCMWGWLVWRMWLRPSWLFVYFLSCVFSLSRFFLVMMSSDSLWMEAGWLVWGRDQSLEESVIVLWLSSSQLPQHRLTIPNYPPPGFNF